MSPTDELWKKTTWNLDFGPEDMSRGDILTNLLLHERGHHGDISTLFHQLGVKGYLLDYRFFVTKRDEFIPDVDDERTIAPFDKRARHWRQTAGRRPPSSRERVG